MGHGCINPLGRHLQRWGWIRTGCIYPSTRTCHTIRCDLFYHELVSGGWSESWTAYIKEMVGEARYIYTRDESRACSSKRGGGIQGRSNRRERESERYSKIGKDVGRETEITRRTID